MVILVGALLGLGISGLFGFCSGVWWGGRSGFSDSFKMSSSDSLSVELSTESSDSPSRSMQYIYIKCRHSQVAYFRLNNINNFYYEQALWSQFNNLHRVCIKLSSFIIKYL